MSLILLSACPPMMSPAQWGQLQDDLRKARRGVIVHRSWPLCGTCQGQGRENECWDRDPVTGGGQATGRVPIDLGGDAYRGLCRSCAGAGRQRPEGWVDPVLGPHGEILHPGSHPELQALAARRRAVEHGTYGDGGA